MVHGELSRVSESVTFGAGYICSAFGCREKCRDKPFSAKRPLSNEADVEKANVAVSLHAAVLPLGSSRLAR